MFKKSGLFKLILLGVTVIFILLTPHPVPAQTGAQGVEGVDYLAGELIIKYTSEKAAKSNAFFPIESGALKFLHNLFGSQTLADLDHEFEVYEKIPLFAFSAGNDQRQSRTIKLGKIGITPPTQEATSNLVYVLRFRKKTVEEAVAAYSKHPDVEYAEPNYIVKAFVTPNDPLYPRLWGLEKIKMPQAWDLTKGSASVIVAVLDTGADYNQTDLVGNLVAGYDIVNSDSSPQDDQGHGTHVSGTIGAITNNELLSAGINWNVSLMPVKVLSASGSGAHSWIAQGIHWAADHNANVINMSLGGPYTSQTMRGAINYAVQNGVVVVAAAGNSASSQPSYPAAYPGVISVVATDSSDRKASFSNYGSTVDISAPGVSICSTTRGGSYGCWSGTSMASPHVAGLAALILAKNPSLSSNRVEQIIETTADDLGNPGRDNTYGYGRINAYRAVQEAGEGGGPTPTSGPTNTPAPTITPGGPTLTTPPTLPPTVTLPPGTGETPTGPVSSCPAVKRNASVTIWTCAYRDGQEVLLAEGDKVTKDKDYVAICYNRLAGPVTVTVDRGGGFIDPRYGNFSSPRIGGCLHSGSQIYFSLGELASPEGAKHTYTLSTGGQTVSTSILVTTGTAPVPTSPPAPTPTPGSSPTPNPNTSPNNPVVNSVTCNPCSIQTGQKATITADVTNQNGDSLTYKWSADQPGQLEGSGSEIKYFANYTLRTSGVIIPVNISINVSDGKGQTASGSVTITVIQP